MKIILDVTGIKNHPDITTVYDFLVEHGFATPFCDEISKFLPDNANNGEHALDSFFIRAKPDFVEIEGEKVKCWSAIVPAGDDKADYMLIVLAECKADEFAKLERVIAEYKWEITHNAGDPNAEYEPSPDTQAILDKYTKVPKCPFCEQKHEVSFGSKSCHMQLDDDGETNVYRLGLFQGAFMLPKCPLCGKDIMTK